MGDVWGLYSYLNVKKIFDIERHRTSMHRRIIIGGAIETDICPDRKGDGLVLQERRNRESYRKCVIVHCSDSPSPSPADQALVAPFLAEATLFPRPETDRTMVANSLSRLNPAEERKGEES